MSTFFSPRMGGTNTSKLVFRHMKIERRGKYICTAGRMEPPRDRIRQCGRPSSPGKRSKSARSEVVLAIASGGEAAGLAPGPARSLTMIDRNGQIHLIEMKTAALRELDHEELLGFIGAGPAPTRDLLYAAPGSGPEPRGSGVLGPPQRLIRSGPLALRRFERFLRAGFRCILHLIHSRRTLGPSSPAHGEVQEAFYARSWSTARRRCSRGFRGNMYSGAGGGAAPITFM
jgi:hypothetical protein